MTRKRQNRVLTIVVAALAALIALALAARLTGGWALGFYDVIRDMSLLIVTVVAAYLAYIYQKRTTFLQNLRDQWYEIVSAKAELIYYCHLEKPTVDDYLIAARELSECIDTMRIVYRNVGETDELIGYYPYSPLHHMRKQLETLDPRKGTLTSDHRYAVRTEIWHAFNAIREHFLDEFDIDEPTRPIVIHRMKRKKQEGGTIRANDLVKKQLAEHPDNLP